MSENEVVAEVPAGEDFASLFEASYAAHKIKRLTNGQAVDSFELALTDTAPAIVHVKTTV